MFIYCITIKKKYIYIYLIQIKYKINQSDNIESCIVCARVELAQIVR